MASRMKEKTYTRVMGEVLHAVRLRAGHDEANAFVQLVQAQFRRAKVNNNNPMPYSTYAKYETGSSVIPMDRLRQILKVLKLTMGQYFDLVEGYIAVDRIKIMYGPKQAMIINTRIKEFVDSKLPPVDPSAPKPKAPPKPAAKPKAKPKPKPAAEDSST